jgi:hypothetical protein
VTLLHKNWIDEFSPYGIFLLGELGFIRVLIAGFAIIHGVALGFGTSGDSHTKISFLCYTDFTIPVASLD